MSEEQIATVLGDTGAKEWRCFFCDDVFTTREAAALHFGCFDACEPDVTACKLMAHQQHVLEYIRGLEEEISQYQAENHPTIKAMYAVEDEMRRAVVKAEEAGYARGVEDMKRQGYCVEPEKHRPDAIASIPDGMYWLIAKGRLKPSEPLYAVQLIDPESGVAVVEAESAELAGAINAAIARLANYQQSEGQ